MYKAPEFDDQPLISREKSSYKDLANDPLYRIVTDRQTLDNKEHSVLQKLVLLFISSMQNDHEVISLVCRQKGTGFTKNINLKIRERYHIHLFMYELINKNMFVKIHKE